MNHIERAQEWLKHHPSQSPVAGGVPMLHAAYHVLAEFGLTALEALLLLLPYNARCIAPLPLGELKGVIARAAALVEGKFPDREPCGAGELEAASVWPASYQVHPDCRAIWQGGALADLEEASPCWLDVGSVEEIPAVVVESLFCQGGRNPQLLVAGPQGRCRLERWAALRPEIHQWPWILAARLEWKAEVRLASPRALLIVAVHPSEAWTAEHRRLLAELEQEGRGVMDIAAAVLLHLARFAPLVAAVQVEIGLEGWFACAGVAAAELRAFARYSVSLGAAPGAWDGTAGAWPCCQMVHLPGAMRPDGGRAALIFWNPNLVSAE